MSRHKQMVWALKAGSSWNPLKRYPRNNPCFCGSELKHKKCCSPYVGEFTPTKIAKSLEKQWSDIIGRRININVRPSEDVLLNPAKPEIEKPKSKEE